MQKTASNATLIVSHTQSRHSDKKGNEIRLIKEEVIPQYRSATVGVVSIYVYYGSGPMPFDDMVLVL